MSLRTGPLRMPASPYTHARILQSRKRTSDPRPPTHGKPYPAREVHMPDARAILVPSLAAAVAVLWQVHLAALDKLFLAVAALAE